MSFFKNIFQSESPVSSRRIIAVWIAFVIISYTVYKGVNEDNAIQFVYAFLGFLAVLLGLTTYQNITKIKKSDGSEFSSTVNPDPDTPPPGDDKPS